MQLTATSLAPERESVSPEPSHSDGDVARNKIDLSWGTTTLVGFRFAFAYLVLYILPFPLSVIPGAFPLVQCYAGLWNSIVPWVGSRFFYVTITVFTNGSGDTTFDYLKVFCLLVIAFVVTIVWSLFDWKRPNYTKLHDWLRVDVRFYLATTMFSYGAVKVIKSQFPYPTLDRLLQPFGDASPMGILWTFMGTSNVYNVFTGAGEILGGLLLTTRRTTLLGAIVSFAVMSHVFMLNFSYDVPVKLFSSHLATMALFLMAPDMGRLARIFVLNRSVEPPEIHSLMGRRWLDRSVAIVRTLLVVAFLGMALWGAQETRKQFGDLAVRSPFYGVWNVDEFEVDGKAHPPLVTDKSRWRRVVFDNPKVFAIQLMSDTRQRFALDLDPSAGTLALKKRDDTSWKTTLKYQQSEPRQMTIEGTLDGKAIRAKLHQVESPDFLLLSRGFHWINEYPFNR
jgi:hypothetical protein